MKRSLLFCVVILAGVQFAFAGAIGMVHDQATACAKGGGIWTLLPQSGVNLCSYTVNGVPTALPCGHCYQPNITDCMRVNGTWVRRTEPPYSYYCILPNGGGIQTSTPPDPGDGPSPGAGVDCLKYGLVSNGIGGCMRPNGGGPCPASEENCLGAAKVIAVDTKGKSFAVSAKGKVVTLKAVTFKGSLPKVGATVYVKYYKAGNELRVASVYDASSPMPKNPGTSNTRKD